MYGLCHIFIFHTQLFVVFHFLCPGYPHFAKQQDQARHNEKYQCHPSGYMMDHVNQYRPGQNKGCHSAAYLIENIIDTKNRCIDTPSPVSVPFHLFLQSAHFWAVHPAIIHIDDLFFSHGFIHIVYVISAHLTSIPHRTGHKIQNKSRSQNQTDGHNQLAKTFSVCHAIQYIRRQIQKHTRYQRIDHMSNHHPVKIMSVYFLDHPENPFNVAPVFFYLIHPLSHRLPHNTCSGH